MIREAVNSDIGSLVRIHCDSLPHSMLPRLGEEFLKKKFYPHILNSDNALLLVKELGGEVVAFGLFAFNGNHLTKEIMKYKASLGAAIIKNVFADFKIFFEALRRVRAPTLILKGLKTPETNTEGKIAPIDEMPEFYELAVSARFRNIGIGSELTRKGLSILREKNQAKCIARPASHDAHDFFLKLGFCDIGKEVRGKSQRFIMAYDLISGLPK